MTAVCLSNSSNRIDFNGSDLKMIDGELVTDPLSHPGQDKNVSGLRKRMKQGAAEKATVLAEADVLIRNTYRTLMTRGMKGTFILCDDAGLQEYFTYRLENRYFEKQ